MKKKDLGFGEKTFTNWFHEWYQTLCNFALRFIHDPDAVEDLVQDVFVSIWKQREHWTEPENLKSYLFVSVRNACIARLKKQQRDQQLAELYELERMDSDVMAREMDEMQIRVRIKQGLEKLPPKCREIFILVKMEGLTYDETASHLSISVKTVEKQLSKAYRLLRKFLATMPDAADNM